MYNSSKALLKGIKAEFAKVFATDKVPTFDKLINRVKSNSDSEKYWIPESLPNIKQWIDERHFGDFSDKSFTVNNYEYDDGLRVDRFTLDDSREYLGGNVEMWIKMLADQTIKFPDILCQSLLTANSNAFDATAFFATSRSNIDSGDNTLNNLLTGTSSTTYSLAEFEVDYKAAKIALLGLRDKNNVAFNSNPKLAVVIPQHLQEVASTLLSSRQDLIYVSGTQSNLYRGDAEIIINWEQTTTTDNDWYIVNLNSPFKPFLIQDRKGAEWEEFDDTKNRFIDYGFYFRMGYAFLNPFCIVKTNN